MSLWKKVFGSAVSLHLEVGGKHGSQGDTLALVLVNEQEIRPQIDAYAEFSDAWPARCAAASLPSG